MPVLATRSEVARLYGRAAFGATAANLDYGSKMPYHDLVLALFPSAPVDARPPASDDGERVDFEGAASENWREMYGPITWWTERMRTTAWPLEERMTLFWHDHFATAFSGGVTTDLLMIQNETLRQHALGDFRALLEAVTVDPAMLNWLNGSQNKWWGVNENYARELLELFAVGLRPVPPDPTPEDLTDDQGRGQQYQQADIVTLARVLTGWRHKLKDTQAGEIKASSLFERSSHYNSAASLWGHAVCDGAAGSTSHATDYVRVIEAVLMRDGVHRYLASQIVRSFSHVPDFAKVWARLDPLVERVAAALRPADVADVNARWDVAAGIRALLLAPEWRGTQPPERQGARQPLETLVHAAKILNVDLYRWHWEKPPTQDDPTGLKIFERKFVDAAAQAGQMPFLPPGVGGWPAGAGWFSTMANMSRYDILHRLHDDWAQQPVASRPVLPASGDLAGWTAFMGLAALSPNTTAQIQAFLADPAVAPPPITDLRAAEVEAARQRGVFILIGTSPDWQVM